MRSYIIAACLLATALPACDSILRTTVDRNDAIEIANRHVSSVLPQVPLDQMRVNVVDEGSAWLVSYAPPDGSTGDTLTVEIRKDNGEILRGLR